MRTFGYLKQFGICILLVIFLISTAQAGDWPMFRHNLAHSGKADDVVEPPLEQAKENAEKAKTVRLGLYGVLILIFVIVLWITANILKRKRRYKQKINEYQSKIEQWKSEGYNVSDLEEKLK